MDDRLAINLAKTELRDAFNAGDVSRVLALFADGFVDWSHELPGKYGSEANATLRQKLTGLFEQYQVKMTSIIVDIGVQGTVVYDWGWHEFILTPKTGGEPSRKRERYFEMWTKDLTGKYRIGWFMSNEDVPEIVNGQVTQWFRSERSAATA